VHQQPERDGARLRVAHVIDSLARGGAERQLVNLVTNHDPELVDSHVITLFDDQDLAAPLLAQGIPLQSLHLRSRRHVPAAVVRLRRVLSALQPDIVHARLVMSDLVARIATVGSSARLISSLEAPTYSTDARRDYSRGARARLEIVRAADLVTGRLRPTTFLACSASVAESATAALRLSPTRMRVLANSTAVPEGDPPEQGPLRAGDEARLLVVGRLSPQKGLVHLLRAMPSIVERFPRVVLDVVGTGPLESSLRAECVRLGIGDHVRFQGSSDDVTAFLRAAHVFVLPSLWEGLSLVLLEALAAGTPTVASDIPSARDVVRSSAEAELVPPGDSHALAEAVVALLEDPARRSSLAQHGRARVLEEFEVGRAARDLEAFYAELLRTGR
jgi:glycosyltransferase involved in cell wall biosynthesis